MADQREPSDRLRDRLLGSSEPDIGCDECFDRLDVYVEAELAGRPAERAVAGMRAHLAGCPACAEEHDSLYELVAVSEGRGR